MEPNENKNLNYSWGEFYETAKNCNDYGEEEKKKFAVFEALDKITTIEEIYDIIMPLSEDEINWLNSPCLDGIVISLMEPSRFITTEYIETWKFYLQKKMIICYTEQICRYKHINVIRLLLTFELNLETKQIILKWAIIHNWIDIVKFLLESKTKNIIQAYSLSSACEYGHTEIAKLLIENGADINGGNPLYRASRYGHIEIVKLLLQYGPIMDTEDGVALRYACDEGHIEIVKLLLKNGANIHVDNDSILQGPARYNKVEIVKFLVEKGANLHFDFDAPLRYAIFNRNLSLARFLLDHGSGTEFLDRWVQNNYRCRELHIMTDFLLDYKQEVNIKSIKSVLNETDNTCLKFL